MKASSREADDNNHRPSCDCDICRNHLSFDMPDGLYASVKKGNVVIFAGAGVSTESHLVLPRTLREDISTELGASPGDSRSFPDLATLYCAKPNGRANLLRKIRERFAYIKSFLELHSLATRFHKELSTLWTVDTIITTNWDDYFETECGATPFVTANDFAFWSVPGRKVLKIHGSVNSYGSIVVSRGDYNDCYERLAIGLLGSHLKMLLATKTVIYVGFSFSDDDFVKIHDLLSKEMGEIKPQSYIVTLDRSSNDRFLAHGLRPIYTDGTFFITAIKKRLVDEKLMIADERFDGVLQALAYLNQLQHFLPNKVNPVKNPSVIYCYSYQDGLRHAFERILQCKNTGEYSHACNVHNAVASYELSRKENLRLRRYYDVAYIDGYTDGLVFFTMPDAWRKHLPFFYVFGHPHNIQTYRQFIRALNQSKTSHKASFLKAGRLVKERSNGNEKLNYHHRPWLL